MTEYNRQILLGCIQKLMVEKSRLQFQAGDSVFEYNRFYCIRILKKKNPCFLFLFSCCLLLLYFGDTFFAMYRKSKTFSDFSSLFFQIFSLLKSLQIFFFLAWVGLFMIMLIYCDNEWYILKHKGTMGNK